MTEFTDEQLQGALAEFTAADGQSGHWYDHMAAARLILEARAERDKEAGHVLACWEQLDARAKWALKAEAERDAALARVRELGTKHQVAITEQVMAEHAPALHGLALSEARDRIAALEAENAELRDRLTVRG